MAPFATTPSLPFSTNQPTALKPRVYPVGTDHPEAAFGLSERVNFYVSELEAVLRQGPEGFDRSLERIGAELLVAVLQDEASLAAARESSNTRAIALCGLRGDACDHAVRVLTHVWNHGVSFLRLRTRRFTPACCVLGVA